MGIMGAKRIGLKGGKKISFGISRVIRKYIRVKV